jgi:hypothetical protein
MTVLSAKKMRALLVGCGSIAPYHCQALKACGYTVEVCDADYTKAFVFGSRWCCKVIETPTADLENYCLIILALPIKARSAWLSRIAAACYSGDLVVEKPVALTSADLNLMPNVSIWCPYIRVAGLLTTLGVKGTVETRVDAKTYGSVPPLLDILPHHIAVWSYLRGRSATNDFAVLDWSDESIVLSEKNYKIDLRIGNFNNFHFRGDWRVSAQNALSRVAMPAGFLWFYKMILRYGYPPSWMNRAHEVMANICETNK